MNVLKKCRNHLLISIMCLAVLMIIIISWDKGIPSKGGQLSIHFDSPRITLIRHNTPKRKIVLTEENGNLEIVSVNGRQYNLNQFKKSQPKKYKKIKNVINDLNTTYRCLVALMVIIFTIGFVYLIPLEFDKKMIITDFICSSASIWVTVLYFTNPSLKSDFLLSIVVLFYSTGQILIKLRTSLRFPNK